MRLLSDGMHLAAHLLSTLQVKEHEQEAAKLEAVFPCILRILPTCVFNKKDPIVVGADVVEGIAKVSSGRQAAVLTLCSSARAVAGRPLPMYAIQIHHLGTSINALWTTDV